MVALALKSVLVTIGMSGAFVAVDQLAPQLNPGQRGWYGQQIQSTQPMSAPIDLRDPLGDALLEWKRLRQSDGYPFEQYARFLIDHRGWPGEDALQRTAERAIRPDATSPALVTTYFDAHPPLSATGRLRYAEALLAVQRPSEATTQARAAWASSGLSSLDAARLQGRFGSQLSPADHDARIDALLWANQTTAAGAALAQASPQQRAIFAARIGYRTRSPDAAARGAAAAGYGAGDAGYLADRANWQVATGNLIAARQGLAQRTVLTARPLNAEGWYKTLLVHARNAANDRQYALAYGIASRVDDAIAPGADVAALSYGERDAYTDLTWLAGQTALNDLGRAADAVPLFVRYAGGSRTPGIRTKGWYWAGRAAERAGRQAEAADYFARAAGMPDTFYGQLAMERTGRPFLAPPPVATRAPEAARQAYFRRETVRAAELLGQLGAWRDQSYFLRQLATDATGDTDHLLGHELALRLNRPDLSVMLGRSARSGGMSDYVAAGYPTVAVPPQHSQNWTIAHGIMRQESSFDRQAVSSAGARGMMQLMPGTAREQAGKNGLPYQPERLMSDPLYNIDLGSSYFRRMLSTYGGSYPLAIAAYNAGPGNVNKWLRANGDPRTGAVDWVVWLEKIPFTETRYYVQRVLENTVVYDLIHPQRSAGAGGNAPLSRYIGKRQPG